jgi:ribose/xylose/arabinose/galactoside ABC-type transport system permease subunit
MKKIKIFLSSLFLGLLSPLVVIKADWLDGLSVANSFALPNQSIYSIIINFLEWLLMIFTILAVLSFVITGIMFFMAGANADNAEKAKKMVTYSIIGIVVGLSGYIIISFLDSVLLANIW